MPTFYVSQTATNSYSVGNDVNSGTSKALAKLTLDGAMTAAASGDNIIVNDGTYTSGTFFNITKGLTITPETPYGVVLRRTGAQTRVVNINYGGAVTLGKIILDAENTANVAPLTSSAAGSQTTLTLNGTKLRNPGNGAASALLSSTALALIVRDVILEGDFPSGGIRATLMASGYADIDGVTFDNSTSAGCSSSSCGPVTLFATAAGVTMHVRRVSGVMKTTGSANAVIVTRGIRGIIERNRGIRIIGTDTSAAIIKVENTSVQADNVVVRYNQGVNECPGQYLILIGTDAASANDNKTNYPHVFRNDVSGTSAASLMHGIMFGNVKGGVMFSNRVRKAAIPLLSKLQIERAYIDDNDVDESPTNSSGCLRAKGSINVDFVGNRVRMSASNMNPPVVINQDPTIPTFASGVSVIGNNFWCPLQMDTAGVVGGAGDTSDGTFLLNNWQAPSYGVNAWLIGSTYYNTLSAWKTAKEPTAVAVDPTSCDPRFWSVTYKPAREAALASAAPWLLATEM